MLVRPEFSSTSLRGKTMRVVSVILPVLCLLSGCDALFDNNNAAEPVSVAAGADRDTQIIVDEINEWGELHANTDLAILDRLNGVDARLDALDLPGPD